jgi:hypothetical protein
MDFRHCQILDPVGSAVAFPKSIEFWKDRRISQTFALIAGDCNTTGHVGRLSNRCPWWLVVVVAGPGWPSAVHVLRSLLYDVATAPLCARSRGTPSRDQRGAAVQGVRGVTRQNRHRLDEARAGASSPSLLAACAGVARPVHCPVHGVAVSARHAGLADAAACHGRTTDTHGVCPLSYPRRSLDSDRPIT